MIFQPFVIIVQYCSFNRSNKKRKSVVIFLCIYYKDPTLTCIMKSRKFVLVDFDCISRTRSGLEKYITPYLMFVIERQLSHDCESAINCLFLCGSDTLSTSFDVFLLIFCEWVSMCWNLYTCSVKPSIIIADFTEWLAWYLILYGSRNTYDSFEYWNISESTKKLANYSSPL